MGFFSDIVRDSRPRPARAPEGGGADAGMLPMAEPLGMAVLPPEPTVPASTAQGEHGERRRRAGMELRASARGAEDPTSSMSPEGVADGEIAREPAADWPGAQAPGSGGAPAEAGGVVEESEVSAALAEAGEEGRAEPAASSVLLPEPPVSPPTVGGEHRQRRRRAGIEPRASARGPEGPTTTPSPEGAEDGEVESAGPESRDRGSEEPPEPQSVGARAPGYGGAQAEADGEDRAATDASPVFAAESSAPAPAAEGAHRQRQRRAGIEPRASARGAEGRSTPTSPEGTEDGQLESAGPESRERGAEEPIEPRSLVADGPVEGRATVLREDPHRVRSFQDPTIRGRAADSPAARAPGSGGAPAEAGGVVAHMAESSILTPAAGDRDRQRRRRAGIEPRASARGPEGPTPPAGPEGAEGSRDPAAEAGGEIAREVDVPETVARPMGLSASPPGDLPGSAPSAPPRDAPRSRRASSPTSRDSRRDPTQPRAAAGPDRASPGSGEGEIPLVEAVSRPTPPPRPLPAVRGGEAGAAGPGTRQRPSREPEGPRVHIGQVDVLVQAPPEPRTASKPERKPTGLTSRLYLRRL